MKPRISTQPHTGDYFQKPFSEVFGYLANNTFSRDQLTSRITSYRNVHYGDILVKYGETLDVAKEELPFILANSIDKAKQFPLLNNGDIIIADTAEDEAVGKCTEIVNVGSAKLIAGLHTMACRPRERFAPGFLGFYMNSPKYHDQLLPLMQGTKVSSVSKTAILETQLIYPSFNEQQEIVNFLTSLNNTISDNEKEIAKLQDIKKAYRSMLFPSPGEKKPRLRFKGFSEDWVSKKLGDCFTERPERSAYGELLSVTQSSGIKRFSEIGRHDNSNIASGNYKVVKYGDIAYNSMRMWQGASGWSPYDGIVSPAYTVIVPKENISSLFFSFLFKKPEIIHLFRINSQGLTSDTWNLKFPAFSQIEVYCPNSFEEQSEIANFLMSVETLISTYSRRLEKLKQVKAACLEGMFVNK